MPTPQTHTISALHQVLQHHERIAVFLQTFGPIFNAAILHHEAISCAAGQQQASAGSSDMEERKAHLPEKWEGSVAPNGAVFVQQQWVWVAREDFFLPQAWG